MPAIKLPILTNTLIFTLAAILIIVGLLLWAVGTG